jgi:hypothetical protein
MAQSHKSTVEQFAKAVSGRQIDHLEHFLAKDVQKTVNSKVIYANLEEAQEYYTEEQQSHPQDAWKVTDYQDDKSDSNKLHSHVSHDGKTRDTTYTFASSGKIQRIDVKD